MKRYLVGLVLILGFGYWGYTWWQDHLAETKTAIASEARQQAQNQAIADMARSANAITDWPATLANNKTVRISPIMTAELQKLWLGDRPVLFIGSVHDVAINKDGTYQVTVEYNLIGAQFIFVENEMRVSLNCPESFGKQLIKTAKAAKSPRITADTAVVALIERIEKSTEKGDEGGTRTVYSGIGKCVDAMQLTGFFIQTPKR